MAMPRKESERHLCSASDTSSLLAKNGKLSRPGTLQLSRHNTIIVITRR